MKYFLLSTYPCLVKARNNAFELEKNDLLEIDEEEFLFVYPTTPEQLPFYINLENPQENQYVSVLKRNEKAYLLLEKQNPFECSYKETVFFENIPCVVEINRNILSFEFNNKKSVFHHCHALQNIKVFKHNSFAVVKFEDGIFLYDTKTAKLSHLVGENISLDANVLSITKNLADSEGRSKIAKYEVDKEVVLQEESFSYSNKKKPSPKALLPYKFLESIKANDFEFAYSLLHDDLKSSLSTENLRVFFGKISTFLALGENEYVAYSNNGKKLFVAFSMRTSKIDDIVLDEL